MGKEYVFWFHYNKPESVRTGTPKVTIHHKKSCHIVDNVVIETNIKGSLRKEQPRFVMKGKCRSFEIINNIAYIK